MFNVGVEVLFLVALTVVSIILLLFYVVVVRLEPQAKLVSVDAPKRPETESAETLEEVTEGPPTEAPERPESVPSGPPESLEAVPAETERETGPPGCSYYLGYLRSRPRNGVIPDECLSCPKILECMHKKWLEESNIR